MSAADRLSPAERQAILRRVVAAHAAPPAVAADDPPSDPGRDVPESCYRIESFPRYHQMQVHRALADRLGIPSPFFTVHDGVGRDVTRVGERDALNFCTYNYLGLNGDPRVSAAAADAAARWGTSASASRLVGGERPVHAGLEAALAALHGTEDAVAFVSGYGANLSIVATIAGPGDLVLLDRLAHNSAIQGAKLSGATVQVFPHNDHRALDAMLSASRLRYQRVLIVVEGVYSMEGDICPLPELAAIRDRHRALLMVDEAHSLGALGARGRGVAEHFGLGADAADIWMGTLSKTLASCGGYAAGSRALVELLKFTAPGFVYSVGLGPPMAAAAQAALAIMLAEPERVARLQANGRRFAEHARAAGLDIGRTAGVNVVPVMIGGSIRTARAAHALADRGIRANPIVYPAVEERAARLRLFLTADHKPEQLAATATAIREVLDALPD